MQEKIVQNMQSCSTVEFLLTAKHLQEEVQLTVILIHTYTFIFLSGFPFMIFLKSRQSLVCIELVCCDQDVTLSL